MNDHEPVWLEQALKGDVQGFSRLVEHYQMPVFNLCYRMLGDSYEAEDAAQEAFLRAYQNMQRYDPQRSFSTWLLSIAAHYCIDQIRKRRLHWLSLDDQPYLDPPDTQPGPEAALNLSEEQRRVQHLLTALNPQDRAAVVMRYWYEFSYEEIAEALGLTVSAVKSRLHRSRQSLADTWQSQESQSAGLKPLGKELKHDEPARSPAFS